jgi:hypothetical protein
MTESEKLEFLEQVKGKKIRRFQWPDNWFFVPSGIDHFDPSKMFGLDERGKEDTWEIEGGFGSWQIVLETSPKSEEKTNDCPHDWKLTQGIFKTYKDCKICNKKWEDV